MNGFSEVFNIWKVLELLAMVTGLVYVILEIKKTRKMWHWMIVASVFNAFVYAHNGFLAMTLIQVYYIVTAVYGIITWSKVVESAKQQHGPERGKKVPVVSFAWKRAAISGCIAVAVFCILTAVSLRTYTPSVGDIPGKPYWDSAVAVLSMLATYWLSQSWYAQWYVWVAVNLAAIAMFLYPVFTGHPEVALPLMGVLYVLYMASTIVGMINWKRHGVVVRKESEQI